MSLRTQEQIFASLQRGMQATADLAIVLPVLAARREKLIADAVTRFNALDPERRLTDRDAVLFVAALAECQRLEDDLRHIEAQGRRDGDKLKS